MDVTDEEIQLRVREIQDYRLTHGMHLKKFISDPPSPTIWTRLRRHVARTDSKLPEQRRESNVSWTTTPLAVTVLPTLFPTRLFEQAQELQPLFNELYVRVANDHDWLHEVLSPLFTCDSFVKSLWGIYERVRAAGPMQDIVCGSFRADYMIDSDDHALKQVEMNVFSASGFAHAQNVAALHRHMQRSIAGQADLPKNDNTCRIADMLAEANRIYQHSRLRLPSTPNGNLADLEEHAPILNGHAKTCILMIVQPCNFNVADERPIEYALWDRNVSCHRCEWQDVLSRTKLQADGTLLFHLGHARASLEVSVIYYRAGYEAREYDSLGCETRLRLEISKAIKCPDIATHLTTCKSIQQALARPGALAHFGLQRGEEAMCSTFMEMHILDNSSRGLEARAIATDPSKAMDYVLKSNGDGGGHNVYRKDIPPFLAKVAETHWCMYTLMKIIVAPKTTGVLMLPHDVYCGQVVSELGMLGTCIWRKHKAEVMVLRNECAGWTLKTKPANVDGMMVVKGVGAMDCPALN